MSSVRLFHNRGICSSRVVSQRAGVFHAGWMVVGVALLVTTAMVWNAQRRLTAV